MPTHCCTAAYWVFHLSRYSFPNLFVSQGMTRCTASRLRTKIPPRRQKKSRPDVWYVYTATYLCRFVSNATAVSPRRRTRIREPPLPPNQRERGTRLSYSCKNRVEVEVTDYRTTIRCTYSITGGQSQQDQILLVKRV